MKERGGAGGSDIRQASQRRGRDGAGMGARGEGVAVGQKSGSSLMAPRLRVFLSLAVMAHLIAVVAEPLRFFTRSPRGVSPVANAAREWLAPYVEFAYLSHGYFFFAPEPGPSHLIDFHLVFEDGEAAVVRYPDRHAQWPRLLYHRHFMLTENLNQLWVPPWQEVSPPPAAEILDSWKRDRQRYELVRDSLARHVAWKFDADVVAVERIEHILPSDGQVFQERMALQDKRLYVVLPDAWEPPVLDMPAADDMAAIGSPPPGWLPERPSPLRHAAGGEPIDVGRQEVMGGPDMDSGP
ncbi:MAG: hypothetical protein KatS3mg111_2760 [Pirellulaceae bacterium]|nr:MAG: hypothetical protein KatS3mg111_2760 [Pirellulaceae bacterium]